MATSPNQGTTGGALGDTGVSSAGATGNSYTGTTYNSDTDSSTARELALKARDKATEVASPYVDRAVSGLESTMVRAASELGSVANALRQCGSDMNGRENAMLLPYVEQVADQVDRLSSFLETRRVDDLARDVEGFARRNPAVFLGACFGVGILAARFLKSHNEYRPSFTDTGYNTSGGYSAGGYNTSRSYQTTDNRSSTAEGGWVGYGEARYTEGDSGFGAGSTGGSFSSTGSTPGSTGNDRAGYDAQRSTAGDGSIGLGSSDSVNGGGAAYSGGFRGTEGTTDRSVGGDQGNR